jgi:nitrate reductase gamma subunit
MRFALNAGQIIILANFAAELFPLKSLSHEPKATIAHVASALHKLSRAGGYSVVLCMAAAVMLLWRRPLPTHHRLNAESL